MLKDDLDLVNLKFLSYPRLIKPLLQFMARNPDIELNSNRVRITIDKFGRTPLDYISCAVEAFKRIRKDLVITREFF